MWSMRKDQGLLSSPEEGFFELTAAGRRAAESPGALPPGSLHLRAVGQPFVADAELPVRQNTPVVFSYDPDERDRQTREHEVLVRRLRVAIGKLGRTPLRPAADDPLFDLACLADDDESLVLIEVKSLSDEHAVHQLRLGLGQVLHYRAQLEQDGREVRPALAVPVEPPAEWRSVCESAGVQLIVAPDFAEPLRRLISAGD
jgi:hypothetical protein